MELQDYLQVLRKRWIWITLIALLGAACGMGATALATPMYEARAQVFVSVRTGGTTSDLASGSSFTQRQVKSYTDLVKSPRVLVPVIEQLALPTTPDRLAESIIADSPLDTVLINILATNEEPQLASDIANATANSLATEVTALEKPENEESPVKISTVRSATAPSDPSSPSATLNLAFGLLLGLALGVGVAILREILDTRVRTEADIKQVTDASVIATIGYEEDAPDHPLVVQTHPHSLRAEAFRRLRTNLQFLDIAERPQTIVITSSLPGEGKSTTSINVAISLADAGSRVALVDADLRRPSIAEYMGLEGTAGLTTVLIGRATLADVVQPWGNGNLHVLASGQVPPNPSELLGSSSMANLLEVLAAEYDVVLIDTPPLLPVTDAAILARLTGGALVVVGADTLTRQQLGESMGSLQTVGARTLGIVLNRLVRAQGDSYAYYDYSPLEPSIPEASTGRAPRNRTKSRRAGRDREDAAERERALAVASQSSDRMRTASGTPRSRRMPDVDTAASLETLLRDPEPSPPNRWPGGRITD